MKTIDQQLNLPARQNLTNIDPYHTPVKGADKSVNFENATGWENAAGDSTAQLQMKSCLRKCAAKTIFSAGFAIGAGENCRYACKNSKGFASSKKQLESWLAAKRNGQLNSDGSPKVDLPKDEEPVTAEQLASVPQEEGKSGLGTGAIIGITLGGLAVIGLITFLILRKK